MTSTSKDRPDTSTADPSKILTEFIIESYKEAEEICSSGIGISGAACGYPTLDRMLMGLRPGQLIVIGGRPAIGKSAFALNLALNAASEGYSVVIFSLEMPGREVAQRLICMNAQINISNFRTGRISPQEWANINEATKDLSRLDIQIKDTPRMTLPEIQSEAARALQGKEKGIVILDNMQLVRQPADRRFDSLAEEVTDLSHELKICARELDVPLILDADALNCLARLSIDGIDKTPELYRREAPLIFTPHHRELSRLLGDIPVDDLGTAIDAAQRIEWAVGSDNLVVVAKGATTAIVGVEKVLIPMAGPASLATAGSGDVLAGILAGTMATTHGEVDRWELLAAYGVAVHSYTGFAAAAEYGDRSVIATDLIDLIGEAMQLVENEAYKQLGLLNDGEA